MPESRDAVDEIDVRIAELVSEYVGLLNSGEPSIPLPEKFVRDKELDGDLLKDVFLYASAAYDLHMENFRSRVRSIREYALAIVEGESEQEAFARGKRGEGFPVHDASPGGLLFDQFYRRDKEDQTRRPDQAEWIRGLFAEHDGWQRADPTGLAERIERLAEDRMLRHGTEWLGWHRLMGPLHETLTADSSYEQMLGGDPEFARVCAQAVGLMLLGDIPPRALGVLDLPPKDGRRRFLFFGMRRVT